VSFQVVIPHLQLNIFTVTTTFHCTPISDDNLEFANRVNENTGKLHLGSINEVVSVVVVYEHYYLMVFNVALSFGLFTSPPHTMEDTHHGPRGPKLDMQKFDGTDLTG
jgi:hypothetical protein